MTDLRGHHVEVVWYNDGSSDNDSYGVDDSDDVSIPDERPALPAAIHPQFGHTARVRNQVYNGTINFHKIPTDVGLQD